MPFKSTRTEAYDRNGHHQVQLQANDLPSGVLQYTLTSGEFIATKKMVLKK